MYRIFIESIDCIIKKVMYHRGLPKQRLFLKCHLLIAARELEQRYDGAKFLTIVLDPIERFYSVINFIKVFSVDGPVSAELLSKAAALQKSSHDRTKRKTKYDQKYNRSLTSLGIDEERLKEYLSDYIDRMNKLDKNM